MDKGPQIYSEVLVFEAFVGLSGETSYRYADPNDLENIPKNQVLVLFLGQILAVIL